MKLAVVCPIGPLDRFGYQYTYSVALESFSLFADAIYLVCSTRSSGNVEDIGQRFPKVILVSNDQTWYALDEAGQEVFDIYQWDRNLAIGMNYAHHEAMDAAVVLPINSYVPESSIQLIHAKIERMIQEDRPYEWVYRRFQLGSKLFVPDAGVPNIINLQLPYPYRVRYDWTESPDGKKIPILYDQSHPDTAREAFVDCGMEMTIDDMRDKFNFTKSYRQINPNAPQQFDFQAHIKDYYLPKFLNKTITEDPLDRFGRMIARAGEPEFVSNYILRDYRSPWRKIERIIMKMRRKFADAFTSIMGKVKRLGKALIAEFRIASHRLIMFRTIGKNSPSYSAYLETQLTRTLKKNQQEVPLMLHTQLLVDKLSQFKDLNSSSILCIGCRNRAEIDYLLSKGAKDVLGIDLYSQSPDILVMDMHSMTFPDGRFDVIYSSHSLEHAYDPNKVAREIIRVARPNAWVAIEVPVQYDVRGADLIDFGDTDNVHKLFGDHFVKAFLSEDLPSGHPRNDGGTAIARTVFQISKKH